MPATRAHPHGIVHRARKKPPTKAQLKKIPSLFGRRSFFDFPVELQLRILDTTLKAASSEAECASRLCRVCKKFYSILGPRLYAKPLQTMEVFLSEDVLYWDQRRALLLRTLAGGSKVASWVRGLQVEGNHMISLEQLELALLKCNRLVDVELYQFVRLFDTTWPRRIQGPITLNLHEISIVDTAVFRKMERLQRLYLSHIRFLLADEPFRVPQLSFLSLDLSLEPLQVCHDVLVFASEVILTVGDADVQDYVASTLPQMQNVEFLCLIVPILLDELYGTDLCGPLRQMQNLKRLRLRDARLCENFCGVLPVSELDILCTQLPAHCSRREFSIQAMLNVYERLQLPNIKVLNHQIHYAEVGGPTGIAWLEDGEVRTANEAVLQKLQELGNQESTELYGEFEMDDDDWEDEDDDDEAFMTDFMDAE